MRNNDHMILSVEAEKVFDQIKKKKLGIKESNLKIMQAVQKTYDQHYNEWEKD
jgi:hypothetical protein